MRHPTLIPLSHDHHHGLALALRCRKQALGQMKPTGPSGLRERAEECKQFFSNHLLAHFRAEEEALFPALRESVAESVTLIEDLLKEHKEFGQRIAQVEAGKNLSKALFEFGDLLERHIRKEERELFPLYERHIEAARAEEIGSEIKRLLAQP
jgi:iron-sulfur cluster repair protein YtfE (RIC family)